MFFRESITGGVSKRIAAAAISAPPNYSANAKSAMNHRSYISSRPHSIFIHRFEHSHEPSLPTSKSIDSTSTKIGVRVCAWCDESESTRRSSRFISVIFEGAFATSLDRDSDEQL